MNVQIKYLNRAIIFLLWCLFASWIINTTNKTIIIKTNTITKSHEYREYSYKQIKPLFKKWYNKEWHEIVDKWCKVRNLNPILVHSLANRESGYTCKFYYHLMIKARGCDGEWGILQIIPKWHIPGQDPKKLENPDFNAQIGTRYLKKCIEIAKRRKFRNIIHEALRLYNQGPTKDRKNYRRWAYVNNIVNNFEKGLVMNDEKM